MIHDQPIFQAESVQSLFDDFEKKLNSLGEEGRAGLLADLKKIRAAVTRSENRFGVMAEGTPVIMWVTDPKGRIEFINNAYTEFFGVTLAEVQHGSWQMLVHPDDVHQYVDVFHECCQQKLPFRAQGRVRRADGEWRWIDSHGQPRFLETGEFLGMAGSSLDITERKQAEAELHAAHKELTHERNLLLAVMEAIPIGLAIYDQNGGLVRANPGFEAVWGSPRPPANSVSDYELYRAWWAESEQRVQPEDWASARAIRNGETVTGQYLEIEKFDGTRGYVLNSGAPVFNEQGRVVGGAVAIMEITDLIKTEQALKESQDRFRVALASVPLLVYTCDLNLRYTWLYNPLLNYRAEEVIGKRDDELLPPEAAAEIIAAKQLALLTGKGGVHEVKVPLNGDTTYFILTTEPMKNSHGELVGLTCSAIDITRQKKLEIEQEENQRSMEIQSRLMAYREKERQEIARELHDGPIQLVAGTIFHLQVAKEMVKDPPIRLELEQAIDTLKRAVRELRDTVNELRPPAILRFGFAKSAKMHSEDFREQHPEVKLELDLYEDGDLLPEMARLALFRIYQESLNNVLKHSGASQVWVQFSKYENQVILEVKDNGSGFVVRDDLLGQTQNGHFGLAGMKERAETVGGVLSVLATPGQGTLVQVVIPISEGEKPGA